ncbi:MAG: hypothetical protein HC906_19580 [Bacteroidales bacterium]|nr:hypothetical protein [Bacteroidales bacterium]
MPLPLSRHRVCKNVISDFIQAVDPYKIYLTIEDIGKIRFAEKSLNLVYGNPYLKNKKLFEDVLKSSLQSFNVMLDDVKKHRST